MAGAVVISMNLKLWNNVSSTIISINTLSSRLYWSFPLQSILRVWQHDVQLILRLKILVILLKISKVKVSNCASSCLKLILPVLPLNSTNYALYAHAHWATFCPVIVTLFSNGNKRDAWWIRFHLLHHSVGRSVSRSEHSAMSAAAAWLTSGQLLACTAYIWETDSLKRVQMLLLISHCCWSALMQENAG